MIKVITGTICGTNINIRGAFQNHQPAWNLTNDLPGWYVHSLLHHVMIMLSKSQSLTENRARKKARLPWERKKNVFIQNKCTYGTTHASVPHKYENTLKLFTHFGQKQINGCVGRSNLTIHVSFTRIQVKM